MSAKPTTWTATQIDPAKLGAPLARAFGWTFYEHPTEGDEHPVLAVSLDHGTAKGPTVWNTGDHDIPDYL